MLRVLGKGNFLTEGELLGPVWSPFRKMNVFVIKRFLCTSRLFDLKVQAAFWLPRWLCGWFENLDLVTSLVQHKCTATRAELTGFLTVIQGLRGRL